MGTIIPRSEAREIEETRGWVLVFGRRKTGKTFIVRRLIGYDYYFFVTRGGEVFDASSGSVSPLQYPVFLERLKRVLSEEAVVVIDEFQRLPEQFLDFLHFARPTARAKVVLVGSSVLVSRRVLSQRSPLLGIVKPVRIGLIRPVDIVAHLSNVAGPYDALRLAPLLRDPWILEFVDYKARFEDVVRQVVSAARYNCRGLVGEVFLEEDRELTERYEAVLRAIADGNSTPGLVANYVSGALGGTLKSQDVKKYVANLLEMGLVKRRRVFGKKRYLYQLDSPLLDLFYYLDARLGFYEIDLPEELVMAKALAKIPLYFEDFIVELLAQLLGAEPQKSLRPEIDGVLVRSGKPIAAIEVKYGSASRGDAARFAEKARSFRCRKILVAREGAEFGDVELLTPRDIAKMVLECAAGREAGSSRELRERDT